MEERKVHTRNQKWAQIAFGRVSDRAGTTKEEVEKEEKYKRFAKSFPALVHSCGLAQAAVFAEARKHGQLLEDVAAVLGKPDAEALKREAREEDVTAYLRLSRDALVAAGWIKRYAEALLRGEES